MNIRKISLSVLMLLFCVGQLFSQEPVNENPPKTTEREIAPPPPPPPPPPSGVVEIFMVVEEMPRFPGCEDKETSKTEKADCSRKAMLEYIYENLEYPQSAIDNQIEGTVVVQFVVTKKGDLKDIKILRDIGDQCGLAAKQVVEKMNEEELRWIPGKQRGRPVMVQYTLPVKFKLNEDQRQH